MRALMILIAMGVGIASAQTMDPAAAACSGLAEGEACEAGDQTGTCQPAECCTGIEPDLVCSACLQCAAPPSPRPAPDGGVAPIEDEAGGCSVSANGSPVVFGVLCIGLWGLSRRRRP